MCFIYLLSRGLHTLQSSRRIAGFTGSFKTPNMVFILGLVLLHLLGSHSCSLIQPLGFGRKSSNALLLLTERKMLLLSAQSETTCKKAGCRANALYMW